LGRPARPHTGLDNHSSAGAGLDLPW
jgi:hypothetical protein